MKTRRIGDRTVSAIGLGGMPMSIEGRPDEERSIRTIHAALDAGITLIDTADAYHRDAGEVGHNESLIRKALDSWSGDRSDILVATKGGLERPGDGRWVRHGDPEYLKRAAKASLERLGGDALDLYQFHRHDSTVLYADSIGALRELVDEGVVRQAGISNADAQQIDIARGILGEHLVSVQNQFSPSYRSSQGELDITTRLGLAFLPWSPLGGIAGAARLGARFAPFAEVAARHGVSPQRVCLAWELALAPNLIPIPGASRPESVIDSAQAPDLELTPDDIAALTAA
ncbi:aldo/keto reductase [Agromyces atrinae]|uniref:aldo/keto reductase n=1 Tax=Agromyces atrinae TaxID=592376 RepID=UPI001F5AB72C|nr:aldo/keto reductase [Agromyces atrinae]MCI2956207.1 aldo/keto reductase [Agromyces atrinae]